MVSSVSDGTGFNSVVMVDKVNNGVGSSFLKCGGVPATRRGFFGTMKMLASGVDKESDGARSDRHSLYDPAEI